MNSDAVKRSSIPWFKHMVRDLASNRKYQNLSFSELGIYQRIREETFMHGGLPADTAKMAAYLGVTEREIKQALTSRVMEFCSLSADGMISCNETTELRVEAEAACLRSQENGRRGQLVKRRLREGVLEGERREQSESF